MVDAHLPSDRETGRPRGFAFITFSNETEAAEAIRRFHDRDLNGRKLVVNAAEPRRPPGSGGGRPPSSGGGHTRAAAPPPPAFFDRGGPPRGEPRSFKTKGSRRGLRAKRRSL